MLLTGRQQCLFRTPFAECCSPMHGHGPFRKSTLARVHHPNSPKFTAQAAEHERTFMHGVSVMCMGCFPNFVCTNITVAAPNGDDGMLTGGTMGNGNPRKKAPKNTYSGSSQGCWASLDDGKVVCLAHIKLTEAIWESLRRT